MGFKKIIFFFVSILFTQLVIAQKTATIKASVDKNRILLGEPLQLTIEMYLSPGTEKKIIVIDSIAHFELQGEPRVDSTEKNGGVTARAVYTITSFDSGHWVIPSFELSRDVKTDSIPVDVVFSDFDPNQEYHTIKDILELTAPAKKIPWWWYAAGAILLLGFATWYWRQRKNSTPLAVPVNRISPYEEAMQKLEQLERNPPGIKQYHSRLTDIFRLYVFRKKGIHSLQKTTDDLIVQLKELNIDKQPFDKLAQSLRLSDFVKFAKYLPSDEDNVNSLREIKNAIMTIEKTEADPPSFGGS